MMKMQGISGRDLYVLVAFVLGVMGVGSVIGMMNEPGIWYAFLQKPGFTPPNWVFAPVWTTLYVLIALAGWRMWRLEGWDGRGMMLWVVQMVLNFAWSPVFFGLHWLGVALLIELAMLAAIVMFVRHAWWRDRISAWLFAPYMVWVAFAGALNAALFFMN